MHKELTQHNTLDHICGVHSLALYIARQVKAAGLPISLAKISGAAAGHDIGKFGCRPQELKKYPTFIITIQICGLKRIISCI
ncbi:hypothetical protein [Caloramator sp. Dgby_cultured_2]|uniref:hypothetical protein n=1 Tax=Caloramator sp. Dgby_cultured_2 TaxID=3029174 RepID=UPI00237DFB0D|nr:hypothetical protein [Caloramator sp. Dgby_cultured_2]WDU83864.1 hypothetical protein PWK10_04945 [Caloramator sp. Dgby_cultured_2]